MFTCMGEIDNSTELFHDESYLCDHDFDKGSALLKNTNQLFKMAK